MGFGHFSTTKYLKYLVSKFNFVNQFLNFQNLFLVGVSQLKVICTNHKPPSLNFIRVNILRSCNIIWYVSNVKKLLHDNLAYYYD